LPFGFIRRYEIQELNRLLKLLLFKEGISIKYLLAAEAWLVLRSFAAIVPLMQFLLNPQAYYIIHFSSHISQNNNNNNKNNVYSPLLQLFPYICVSITSLKIMVQYQIITNITNSITNVVWFIPFKHQDMTLHIF